MERIAFVLISALVVPLLAGCASLDPGGGGAPVGFRSANVRDLDDRFEVVFALEDADGETVRSAGELGIVIEDETGAGMYEATVPVAVDDYAREEQTRVDGRTGERSTVEIWVHRLDVPYADVQPATVNDAAITTRITFSTDGRTVASEEFGDRVPDPLAHENEPPVAVIEGPSEVWIGEEVTFDGSGSYDPENGSLSYSWEFRGATYGSPAAQPTIDATFDTSGTRQINLTVKDPELATDTASTPVTVRDVFDITVQGHGRVQYGDRAGEVYVDVRVENRHPEAQDLAREAWDVETEDGGRFGWAGDDPAPPDRFSSGQSASWRIFFDVPQDRTPATLVYDARTEVELAG